MESILSPYLVFPGTCLEAITFYAKVFEGEITALQTFGESPIPVREKEKKRIYNAELISPELHLKCSDDLPRHPVQPGTNISLFLHFNSESEKLKVFKDLSEEGKVLFPITDNFGMVRDKYGIQWMVVHEG